MCVKHYSAIVIGLGLVLSPAIVSAQRGTGKPSGVAQQAVKPATVELVGTLESIHIGRCESGTGRGEVGMHLIVVTKSGEKLNIHMGPVSVAQQWIESLQIGEELVIQAFATSEHAQDHYVARRLDVSGVVINVRDETLQPSWARGNRGRGQANLGRGNSGQGARRFASGGGPGAGNGRGCGQGGCRQWDDANANSGFRGQKAQATTGQGRGRGQGAATRQGRGQGRGQGQGQGRGGGGRGQFGRQGQGAGRVQGLAPRAAINNNPVNGNSLRATGKEIDHILFVREEEKLARDVYLTLAQHWTLRIFDNISEAEQRHMDAMRMLVESHALTDPVTNDAVGVFTDATLQRLYDDLTSDQVADLSYLGLDLSIEGGASSQLAALKVGAFVEEFDILDIMRRQEDVTRPDATVVYDNLLRASRNHLRAFVSVIKTSSAVYEPVLMIGTDTQLGNLDTLYLNIISGDHEMCKQNGRGGRGGCNALSPPCMTIGLQNLAN